MTLLRNIVCDPSGPMAPSDLKLVEPLLVLLGVLIESPKGRRNKRISNMHQSCMELFEKASKAVQGISLADMDWDQCPAS